MVELDDLRRIKILESLSDEMLGQISTVAQLKDFEAGTILFRRNEKLEYFYLVLSGNVALEVESSEGGTMTLAQVLPGNSFGISTFIPGTRSSATAQCLERCRLIILPGKEVLDLFEQDGHLGYTFMLQVMRIFKSRMTQRTRLFLRSLERHPEIQSAFRDLGHMSPA